MGRDLRKLWSATPDDAWVETQEEERKAFEEAEASEGWKDLIPAPRSAASLRRDPDIVFPPFLIKDLLFEGNKLIVGSDPKAGKSWWMLQLATCIANGIPFVGFETQKAPVLVIDFELPDYQHKFRTGKVREALGLPPEDAGEELDIMNLRGIPFASAEALIDVVLERVAGRGYKMVVIDPAYNLYKGLIENAVEDMVVVLEQLTRLASGLDSATALSLHYPKGDPWLKRPIDRFAGSNAFVRDADHISTLTRGSSKSRDASLKEDDVYLWEFVLRGLPPVHPLRVERGEDFIWKPIEVNEEETPEFMAGQITTTKMPLQDWYQAVQKRGIFTKKSVRDLTAFRNRCQELGYIEVSVGGSSGKQHFVGPPGELPY